MTKHSLWNLVLVVFLVLLLLVSVNPPKGSATPAEKQLAGLDKTLGSSPTEHLYIVEVFNQTAVSRHIAEGNSGGIDFWVENVTNAAVEDGATDIILLHNHPGGDGRASDKDIYWMEEIRKDAAARGVTVMYSVVATGNGVVRIP